MDEVLVFFIIVISIAVDACIAYMNMYNTRLPHGAIGYKTPDEYGAEYWDQYA